VYIKDITSCKAYHLKSYNDLTLKKSLTETFAVKAKDNSFGDSPPNAPDRYAEGPPIIPNYWPSNGPVACDHSTVVKLMRLLRDPSSYGPGPDPGILEALNPDYIFYVNGPNGSLTVEMQTSDGSFAVNEYDKNGTFLETSGAVRGKGDWTSIIQQAFPNPLDRT